MARVTPDVTPRVTPAPFIQEWRRWLERQVRGAGLKQMVQQALLEGLKAHQLELAQARPGQIIALDLPFLRAPIHLRAGTSDLQVLLQIFVDGSYAFPEPVTRQPTLIVDAGANIGLSSIFLANQFPHAHLVAIEPEASNVELLKANLAAYDAEVWQAGLWGEACDLTIVNPDAAAWAFQTRPATGRAASVVPGVTVERVMARCGAEQIGILKIDIEGAERSVFSDAGVARWIRHVDALFIELHDRFAPGCAWTVYRAVAQVPFMKHQRGDAELFIFTPESA
jgi:FkbM family methyltransferase